MINHGMIMKALDYCYEKAVTGMHGFDTVEELSNEYMSGVGTVEERAEKLVRRQIVKAGTSGFFTGLGGVMAMPLAIPANITSVLYIQIRMIAAIARMGNHNVREDQVKTLVVLCVCGNAMTDLLKDAGIRIGTQLTVSAINRLSGAATIKINQAVGGRLLTKYSQTGIASIGRYIPLIGGVIGATIDGVATKAVGKIAIRTFL